MPDEKLPSLNDLNNDLPSLEDLNSGAKKKSRKSFSERWKQYIEALSIWWSWRPKFPDKWEPTESTYDSDSTETA